MTKYLIADDEPIAHRIIERYCKELPHLEKTGNAYDAFEAMQILNQQTVDLIFLDINMPKMTGFEFLKTLRNPPKVIVTSAYKEFALEGYELDISDYLLKPFSLARFLKAINKTLGASSPVSPNLQIPASPKKSSRFFLKGDKKHHQIHLEDLLFIEAKGNYSKLFLKDENILSHEKISSFETLLPKEDFLRVHKSFIVALDKIKLIEGNQISIERHKIPIGQTYKGALNQLIRK
jgi:DNA-binding LytR/AlgR family response regulator